MLSVEAMAQHCSQSRVIAIVESLSDVFTTRVYYNTIDHIHPHFGQFLISKCSNYLVTTTDSIIEKIGTYIDILQNRNL